MRRIPILLGILAILGAVPAAGQEPAAAPEQVWLTFWNVENLFAPKPDQSAEERKAERALGIRRPTREEYAEKRRRLRETLRRVNWGKGPDVIGLAEVESREVIADLLPGDYEIVFHPGAYRRKLNVGLAVRKGLPLAGQPRFLSLVEKGAIRPTGRSVIHATVKAGETPLHLFVLHMKSKRNVGPETGETRLDEQLRRAEAALVRAAVDGLGEDADVVVMGDFNEDHRDALFRDVLLARSWHRGDDRPDAEDGDRRLLNLGGALQQSFPEGGTHYYEPVQSRYGKSYFGRNWSILDNFLVSEPLAIPGGLYTTPYDAFIGVSWDLLNHLATPGKLRRPHESKPHYPTGVSDHLPIHLRVMVHRPR